MGGGGDILKELIFKILHYVSTKNWLFCCLELREQKAICDEHVGQ